MHPNPTLEPRLECYGADYALLRPEHDVAEPPVVFIPRAQLPQFVVRTQTVYLVAGALTAARALQWFADANDIDLDVETLDFGTVEVVGQVGGQPEDLRYWPTDGGRRALADTRDALVDFARTMPVPSISAGWRQVQVVQGGYQGLLAAAEKQHAPGSAQKVDGRWKSARERAS